MAINYKKAKITGCFLFIAAMIIMIITDAGVLFKHEGEVRYIQDDSLYHVLEPNMEIRQLFKAKGSKLETIKIKFGNINKPELFMSF